MQSESRNDLRPMEGCPSSFRDDDDAFIEYGVACAFFFFLLGILYAHRLEEQVRDDDADGDEAVEHGP